jgi:deoxyribonuclease IV
MLIGAHQSVAGGHFKAFATAEEDGCDAIQVFTKNASQWKEPIIGPEQVTQFRDARGKSSLGRAPVLCHDSYLINLCAKDRELLDKSRHALLHEALRCEQYGIDYIVLHPGAHLGAGVDAGTSLIVESLSWVLERTRGAKVSLLVENTAAQGTVMASRFEEVGAILRGTAEMAGTDGETRTGLCLDTCHAFAAGYDLSHAKGFDAAWAELDRHVGISRLKAMHLNDSQKGLGCRLDRHERIGEGELGKYAFWRLQNDPALASVVAVLETAPVEDDRFFKQQLAMLRGFVGAPPPPPKRDPDAPFSLSIQEPPKEKPKRRAKHS